MPNPIPLKQVLKVLKKNGFFLVSQKGSHAKFRKDGKIKRTVIIKISKKEIPHGTFHQSILLQTGLKKEDFEKK